MATTVKRIFSILWQLIVVVWRVLFGLFVLGLLALVFVIVSGPPAPQVGENVALVWAPQGAVVEHKVLGPGALIRQITGGERQQTSLRSLVTGLRRAANDPRITMAVLRLGDLTQVGMAQLQELGSAIRAFKASGKKVIAYARSYTQPQYYLAALADKVYLDPMGAVVLRGFGIYRHYFEDALDQVGIKVHVFRVGEYKAAVEPFIRNSMSPQAQRMNLDLLHTLWSIYKTDVAHARGLPPEAIDRYINNFPAKLAAHDGDMAELALAAGLVDKLMTPAELQAMVAKTVGVAPQTGDFRRISNRNYLRATGGLRSEHQPGKVGLIVLEGPITLGESGPGVVGSATVARQLRKVRQNDSIDAVVLRVNSPGGSALASEIIRRAVVATREAGKPVVASMSSVAASGGYWAIVNANQIWAQPSTLTGSIGIFGLIPNFHTLLENLGIHTDGVGTHALTGALRPDRPMSQKAARIVQLVIQQGYQRFLHRVAKGRDMSVAAVNEIAQGRVWTGRAAERLGLVDHLGGLRQAVAAAAELAGLQKGQFMVVPIVPKRSLRERLLAHFLPLAQRLNAMHLPVPGWLIEWLLQPAHHEMMPLSWRHDSIAIYAYCPCWPDLGRHTGKSGLFYSRWPMSWARAFNMAPRSQISGAQSSSPQAGLARAKQTQLLTNSASLLSTQQ